jgi:hypothetical protein
LNFKIISAPRENLALFIREPLCDTLHVEHLLITVNLFMAHIDRRNKFMHDGIFLYLLEAPVPKDEITVNGIGQTKPTHVSTPHQPSSISAPLPHRLSTSKEKGASNLVDDNFEAEGNVKNLAAADASPLLSRPRPQGKSVATPFPSQPKDSAMQNLKNASVASEDVFGDSFADDLHALDSLMEVQNNQGGTSANRSCPRTPRFQACSEDLVLAMSAMDQTNFDHSKTRNETFKGLGGNNNHYYVTVKGGR